VGRPRAREQDNNNADAGSEVRRLAVSDTYYGLTRDRWDELDPRGRWEEMNPRIKEAAKKIDPGTFVSWFQHGSTMDPYSTCHEGEDNIGRVWWVRNPDDEDAPVTAWDFIKAHPLVAWDEIYAREEQWWRDLDPFHGMFR
jgi:hypothetical protein